MSNYSQWDSIQSVTPTLCELFQLPSPVHSAAHFHDPVLQEARRVLGERPLQKCLVFAPDALGCHLHADYSHLFTPVKETASFSIRVKSVVPPVTPVCFASMFTGAPPTVHGILKYEKPVLSCDTVFDALTRGGIRVALVSLPGCSIDQIFRRRAVDYFTMSSDQSVVQQTIQLIQQNEHDFILAYVSGYDDSLHYTTPFSEVAIQQASQHTRDFFSLGQVVQTAWADFDRALLFTPDHGAHLDELTGKGDHGLDIAADMQITHYYGFFSAGRSGLAL